MTPLRAPVIVCLTNPVRGESGPCLHEEVPHDGSKPGGRYAKARIGLHERSEAGLCSHVRPFYGLGVLGMLRGSSRRGEGGRSEPWGREQGGHRGGQAGGGQPRRCLSSRQRDHCRSLRPGGGSRGGRRPPGVAGPGGAEGAGGQGQGHLSHRSGGRGCPSRAVLRHAGSLPGGGIRHAGLRANPGTTGRRGPQSL